MLTALKELYEDSKRHSSDRKANSNKTQIFDKSTKKFIDTQWRNLCVGDVIKVQGGSFFPADLILLSSSDPGGICYIETANLDGETNLKLREALPVTLDYTSEDKIDGLEGQVECEQPNSNLYKFNGNIKLMEQDHASPLNLSSLLLRGAKLMNTEWICANENSKLFFVSMAVCHTVIPERLEGGQTGEVEYNASSPDEKALVEGAAHFGFQFIERHPNTVEVKIEGQNIEEFEVLDTIEFTSTRKRMSCVTRFPNGKICLLIKGADNIINDRLGPSERTHRQYLSSTFGHLEDFARKGLRTLCFAVRDIPEAEYKAWKEEYIEACNAIENREEKVEEVAAKLERDLTLIGATAIEDKLQDGVPETIANLLSANIKVWILTGDKQETAINIGHSCKLLSQDVPLIILNTTDLDTTREEITKELADKKASSGDDAVSLIIDGKTLVHALNDSLRKDFIDLCSMCNAVICCRVSPIQKAEVVELVQEHTKAITLSIGDGANDDGNDSKGSSGSRYFWQ
eukprot:08334.XXX_191794_193509_1 [CDS] Oithona nana genome sequencing.